MTVGALLFVGTAHTVPVTYDFTGSPSSNPLGLVTGNIGTDQITVQSGGLAVVITGSGDADATIHRNGANGLGVRDSTGGNRVNPAESLEFDFTPVTVLALNSVVLEGGSGSFDLYVDNVFAKTVNFDTGGGTQVVHGFGFVPNGKVFDFIGVQSGFRVARLSVDTIVNPEPSTWLLFGTGVICLAIYSRRRHKLTT